MCESPSPKPNDRESAAEQQAEQLESWEDEGGTTVPAGSRPDDRAASRTEPGRAAPRRRLP